MTSTVYLDHAGATLYTSEQLEEVFGELKGQILGNPHSRHPSSSLCSQHIDQARYLILRHFNTNQDEYSVIFTSGTTASLKLLAECFDFQPKVEVNNFYSNVVQANDLGSTNSKSFLLGDNEVCTSPCFAYLLDNHTSVVGMREIIKQKKNIRISCLTAENVEHQLRTSTRYLYSWKDNSLFVYPAESNFCGRKYPLGWISLIQQGLLGAGNWFVCVDAATFAGTNPLDLDRFKPDFVTVSFYKMFGYPTGLGALLVRNESSHTMVKHYFGGGSVLLSLPKQDFCRHRKTLHERLEDGSVDFLGIVTLKHGFNALEKKGGMEMVSSKVFEMAQLTFSALSRMRHGNGAAVAEVFCHESQFTSEEFQGGILNFNMLRPDGSYVGYSEVEKMAELYCIHLRTGCCCNQGACQQYLQLEDDQLRQHFNHGKVCGDEIDLINGKAVGSVRISFGWTSTLHDVKAFLGMVYDCFVVDSPLTFRQIIDLYLSSHSAEVQNQFLSKSVIDIVPCVERGDMDSFRLTDILLYPVKSTAVLKAIRWPLSASGLAFDRKWMVTDKNGLCLTQKRCPNLRLVQPKIDFESQTMLLSTNTDSGSYRVVLFETGSKWAQTESKVCVDRINFDLIARAGDSDERVMVNRAMAAAFKAAKDSDATFIAAEWVASKLNLSSQFVKNTGTNLVMTFSSIDR